MSTEYRLTEGTAVVRRPTEVTLLALDGRADPQPIVLRDTGIEICDALRSWVSLAELVAAVDPQHEGTSTAEIEAGVQGFVDGLRDFGVVSTRRAPNDTEHHSA